MPSFNRVIELSSVTEASEHNLRDLTGERDNHLIFSKKGYVNTKL
jgi:hypothetical protein